MFKFDNSIKKILSKKKSPTFSAHLNPTKKVPKVGMPPTMGLFGPAKRLFGDRDKDGVMNFRDCKVNDKRFHGGEAMWRELDKKNIFIGATPKKRKLIRRRFEQNPELLKLASGVSIYGDTPKQATGNKPIGNYNPQFRDLYLNDDLFKKKVVNIRGRTLNKSVLPHEAQHAWDYKNLPFTEIDESEKQRKILSRKYPKEQRNPSHPNYENFRKEYYNIPLESRARFREQTANKEYYQVPQEEVTGASVAMQKRWDEMDAQQRNVARKNLPDTDGDRVPDDYDCSPNNTMRQDRFNTVVKKEKGYITYQNPEGQQIIVSAKNIKGLPSKEDVAYMIDTAPKEAFDKDLKIRVANKISPMGPRTTGTYEHRVSNIFTGDERVPQIIIYKNKYGKFSSEGVVPSYIRNIPGSDVIGHELGHHISDKYNVDTGIVRFSPPGRYIVNRNRKNIPTDVKQKWRFFNENYPKSEGGEEEFAEAFGSWMYNPIPSPGNKSIISSNKPGLIYSPEQYEKRYNKYIVGTPEGRQIIKEQEFFDKNFKQLKFSSSALEEDTLGWQQDIQSSAVQQSNLQLRLQKGNEDTDGDGVINVMDCDPQDKDKQDWDIEAARKQGYYIENMSPTMFLKKTEGPLQTDISQRQTLQQYSDYDKGPQPITRLGRLIKSPDVKVPIPFVGGKVGMGIAEHEGRHRAYASELAGLKNIPVRAPHPPSWRSEDVVNSFLDKRFPLDNFGEGYRNQWRDRFKNSEFPNERMDKQSVATYRDVLIEKGLMSANEDIDRDGLINSEDCDPFDKNKQGWHNNRIRVRRLRRNEDDEDLPRMLAIMKRKREKEYKEMREQEEVNRINNMFKVDEEEEEEVVQQPVYGLINKTTGKRIRYKDNVLTPMFDYPTQANKFIDKRLGGSENIRIKKFSGDNDKKVDLSVYGGKKIAEDFGFNENRTVVHGTSLKNVKQIIKDGRIEEGTLTYPGRGGFEDAALWAKNTKSDQPVVIMAEGKEDLKRYPGGWVTVGKRGEEREGHDVILPNLKINKYKIFSVPSDVTYNKGILEEISVNDMDEAEEQAFLEEYQGEVEKGSDKNA